LAAVALGAIAAVALVSLHGSSHHTTELESNPGFKPYNGQMLFTLNDFTSGRVSYPSQNLANGQGIPQPAANGADHRLISVSCTATDCHTLPHTATHCNTLQHTATRCHTLQQ